MACSLFCWLHVVLEHVGHIGEYVGDHVGDVHIVLVALAPLAELTPWAQGYVACCVLVA